MRGTWRGFLWLVIPHGLDMGNAGKRTMSRSKVDRFVPRTQQHFKLRTVGGVSMKQSRPTALQTRLFIYPHILLPTLHLPTLHTTKCTVANTAYTDANRQRKRQGSWQGWRRSSSSASLRPPPSPTVLLYLMCYSLAYTWVVHKSVSVEYKPLSEPLHISAK